MEFFLGCVVGWVRGAKDRRLPYSRVRCAKARCVDQVRVGGVGPDWLVDWIGRGVKRPQLNGYAVS